MNTRSLFLRTLGCLAGLLLVATGAVAAEPEPTSENELPPSAPVATIGKTPVTYEELQHAAFQPLSQEEAEYTTHRDQLRLQYERSRHETLDAEIVKLVNKRVLDLEAQAGKTTPEKLLAQLEKPTVTSEEVRRFYEDYKQRTQESFEALQGQIKDHLLTEKAKSVEDKYYASLRAKYHAEVTLEPLRATVGTRGPSRGPSTAPVTIVEFADFQCPFCRQMEPVLQQALKRYPDTVRLVFRNFPLTEIHPEAMHAAQAAVCADEQGKFWELHDALFADNSDLSIPGLRVTVGRIGIDSHQFEECVQSHRADGVIQQDMLEATGLALAGTPALFVNGRLIPGTVPLPRLTALIDDELRRQPLAKASERHLTGAR